MSKGESPEEVASKANRFVDSVEPLSARDLQQAVSFRTYDADVPPDVNTWVGRSDELSLLNEIQSGVIAITGIGGQGKSSLASQSLEQWRSVNKGVFWDWRDCREEGERFSVQLASIIYRITLGRIDAHSLAFGSAESLARLFFRLVKDSEGLIVLDNVDHYVDVEQGTLSGALRAFVHEALRCRTKFKIILTCRPRISFADLLFREIPLVGLSQDEAVLLFRRRGVIERNASVSQIAQIHRFTKGHPFWLTVLASEVERKRDIVPDLIRQLESGRAEDNWIVSMLRPVWNTVNDREREIMLMLSECPKALSETELESMISVRVTSSSQIRRALRAVVAFGLVAKKSSGGPVPLYELHPLVRQYVRTDIPPQERLSYCKVVADCTEQYIVRIVKEDGKTKLSIETFEFATVNIESLISSGDKNGATRAAISVADAFIAKGLIKEFVRIGDRILACYNFEEELDGEASVHHLVERMLMLYVEANQTADARAMIQKYSPWMPKDTPFRMQWELQMCRIEWLLKNYSQAIMHGRAGVELKKKSGIDTRVDATHNLHLALRDGGFVDEALRYFLKGAGIKQALDANAPAIKFSASDFGNAGRCLFLKNDAANALEFYSRSWELLRSEGTRVDVENQGWAGLWIAEALVLDRQYELAANFLAYARDRWSCYLPLKLSSVYDVVAKLPDGVRLPDPIASSETTITCDKVIQEMLTVKVKVKDIVAMADDGICHPPNV